MSAKGALSSAQAPSFGPKLVGCTTLALRFQAKHAFDSARSASSGTENVFDSLQNASSGIKNRIEAGGKPFSGPKGATFDEAMASSAPGNDAWSFNA